MGIALSLVLAVTRVILNVAARPLHPRLQTGDIPTLVGFVRGPKHMSQARLTEGELSHLENEAVLSWATMPIPPEGMRRCDVIIHMLESPGYSASPGVLDWPDSNHITYQTLWGICQKVSRRGPIAGAMRRLLMGRSREGYLAHHRAGLAKDDTDLPRLSSDPDVMRYMAELGTCEGGGSCTHGNDTPGVSLETIASGYMFNSMEEMVIRACTESLSSCLK